MPDDYVSEFDLKELGIDPVLVRILCPWAIALVGHDGARCWARADLEPLFGVEGGEE
ncbi:hypothetical protein VT84_12500 [Gemmata sp. SH-PL17]|uniref:hypothetical protein n=1 Tax=Gemmata sp. SH-PL17 TaxID=1630693 RepID=UPI00078C57B6|nr:hypothetical protein [Gemmata sp. SH-PL17]AMV25211.1 hypothetical protein VT84_12500 [Gemmata sp. SH-PL17]